MKYLLTTIVSLFLLCFIPLTSQAIGEGIGEVAWPDTGSGGGGSFSTITSGTNTSQSLTIGAGSVLAPDITTNGIVRASEGYFFTAYGRPDDNPAYAGENFSGLLMTVTTATGAATGNISALELDMDMEANSGTIISYRGILMATPELEPTGTTIQNQIGLHIQDQRGMGGITDAVRIDPQICGTGCSNPERKGHVVLGGGNWDNGHIAIENGSTTGDHLWRDQTNEVFRVSTDSAPSSETNGNVILTSSGNANWGPMFWGVSDAAGAAVFDTGTEICTLAALTCVDSDVMGGDGSATTCATSHANGANFWAFCQ